MNRRIWLGMLTFMISLVLVPILWLSLGPDWETKTTQQFTADRAELEAIALQVLEQGNTDGIPPPDGWSAVELYSKGITTVEFEKGGFGMGSETVYWGINYVPSDSTMVGFQGQQWDYWKARGEGRLYYDPEGDNTCYVRKLDVCWYYYEMKF